MLDGTCPYCDEGDIIWGGDHSYEDFGMEGDGIVQNFSCSVCGVSYEVFVPFEDS